MPPAKSTVIGVQAPVPVKAPAVDDTWDVAPSDEDKTAVAVKVTAVNVKAVAPVKPAASPPAPAVTPQMPAVAPAAVTPAAPVAQAQGVSPSNVGVTSTEVRLIVRAIVDEALAPMVARLSALERLAAAAAATPRAAPVASAAPPVAAVAPHAQYNAAMAPTPQPARVVVAVSAPPPPLLDVKAIERDIPVDFDMTGFDGTKRKRRAKILFFLAIVIIFGGMFAMLAQSYMPHH